MHKFVITSDGDSVSVQAPDARFVRRIPHDVGTARDAERLALWWVIERAIPLLREGEKVRVTNRMRSPVRDEKIDAARILAMFGL